MPHPFSHAGGTITMAGDRTLTADEVAECTIWSFDTGGSARNLTLPDADDCAGLVLFIANKADAAEVLTIKDGAGTICTPTQAESAIVWSDGSTWDGGTLASS